MRPHIGRHGHGTWLKYALWSKKKKKRRAAPDPDFWARAQELCLILLLFYLLCIMFSFMFGASR
jgi:hypothetical protein